jgi:hypothetical protein
MARSESTPANTLVGLAVGGIGPIAVGALLVPLRSEIDNANLALILMFVVTVAAIVGGRGAGALAAVTSTFAFDFFLTRPFLSVGIDSADDIETAIILLSVGLLVGEIAARGRKARREHEQIAQAILRVHSVAERIAHGATLDDVATMVKGELIALLGLFDCWIELPPFTWVLPRLERAGTLEASEHRWLSGGFALPQDGVELAVLDQGREVARLVLLGDPDVAVTLEDRVVAVALADQLGSALARASDEDLQRVAFDRSKPDGW